MFVPIPILAALALLATPTATFLLFKLDTAMTRRGRRILGNVDDFREDGTYTVWTHLLYVRIRTERGCHSTAWFG